MSEVDIFNSAKPQDGEFFKFKTVGDAVQGTYIDVRDGVDGYGNRQTIYVISDANGKIWNLGFRETAQVVHERMKGIRFGQIVGFRYDEERESKKNPGTKAKIVRVYADPKLVDHDWLKQQEQVEARYSRTAPVKVTVETGGDGFEEFDMPSDVSPTASGTPKIEEAPAPAPAATSADPLTAIRNLAKTKGLALTTMSDAEVDQAVSAYTGLPLVEENYTQTIIKLASFSK